MDTDRQLLGILTVDDIIHLTEKTNTRTIQSIGGSEALDESYLSISLARMFRKRGGWLVILFISEMLTAPAMSFFEDEIALTVGLALVGVVLWRSLSGSMLPFILKRAKLDPATSSAPFVATLVDVTGLIIYFSVAYAVLKGTLL